MSGMFWAGLLLSLVPLALSVAFGVFLYRCFREERETRAGGRTD